MAGLRCVSNVHHIVGNRAETAEALANFRTTVSCSPARLAFGSCRWKPQKRASAFCVSAKLTGEEEAVASSAGGLQSGSQAQGPRMAADLVQEYYDLFNDRDVGRIRHLLAEDCVFDDFNFPQPKKGREEIMSFLEKFVSSWGPDLKFKIDDMTRDDPDACGMIWHLEWRGKEFPFSKGCSFYRCEMNTDGERQIKYGRDLVEKLTRPGDSTLGIIKFLTGLLERFPWLANQL